MGTIAVRTVPLLFDSVPLADAKRGAPRGGSSERWRIAAVRNERMHMSRNKLTKTARDQQIIEALGSQLKTAATITLNGKVYKAKDLQQQFQAEVDAAKVTQSA